MPVSVFQSYSLAFNSNKAIVVARLRPWCGAMHSSSIRRGVKSVLPLAESLGVYGMWHEGRMRSAERLLYRVVQKSKLLYCGRYFKG